MSGSVAADRKASQWQFHLAAPLYLAPHLAEMSYGDEWLIYTPDVEGLPVLVPAQLHYLLHQFTGGSTLAGALARAGGEWKLPDALRAVNWLLERGFLLDREGTPDHLVENPHTDASPPPESLWFWIHITNNCNLACQYCFVAGKNLQRMSDLVIEQTVKRIGHTARKYHPKKMILRFAGGEPTLAVPSIDLFLNLLTREMAGLPTEVEPCILTNGTVYNDQVARLLRRSRSRVIISLDGYGLFHDIYRVYKSDGKGSWAQIDRNISAMLADGININVNATISAETAPSLPALLRWLVVERGIHSIHLGIIHNLVDSSWDRGVHERPGWYTQLEQLRAGFEKAFEVLEDPNIKINLCGSMLIQDLDFSRPYPSICCGIGWNQIVIRHDGQIASCPMTVNEQSFPVDDDLFKTAKQTFPYDPRELAVPECRRCQWYKVCACGCPVTNMRLSGNPFARSPMCAFFKYVIPRYLLFYGRKLRQLRQSQNGSLPTADTAPSG